MEFPIIPRPFGIERTFPTPDFVELFDTFFSTYAPNVVVTLVSDSLTPFIAPLVAIFSNPTIPSDCGISYDIDPSAAVANHKDVLINKY